MRPTLPDRFDMAGIPSGYDQTLREDLGDLHGVQRRTLAQVVVADEEDETLALSCRLVGTDAADEARVLARRLQRGRNLVKCDAGSRAQDLAARSGVMSRANSTLIDSE